MVRIIVMHSCGNRIASPQYSVWHSDTKQQREDCEEASRAARRHKGKSQGRRAMHIKV